MTELSVIKCVVWCVVLVLVLVLKANLNDVLLASLQLS